MNIQDDILFILGMFTNSFKNVNIDLDIKVEKDFSISNIRKYILIILFNVIQNAL